MAIEQESVSRQIAAKLTEALKARFSEHADSLEAISPLIGPLVSVGIAEGQAAVDSIVDGLLASDNYPAWRTIYEQATAEERIALNDSSRKQLMLDALAIVARNKQLCDVLKITAGVIGSALLAVL